jgi:hypothetical protein
MAVTKRESAPARLSAPRPSRRVLRNVWEIATTRREFPHDNDRRRRPESASHDSDHGNWLWERAFAIDRARGKTFAIPG